MGISSHWVYIIRSRGKAKNQTYTVPIFYHVGFSTPLVVFICYRCGEKNDCFLCDTVFKDVSLQKWAIAAMYGYMLGKNDGDGAWDWLWTPFSEKATRISSGSGSMDLIWVSEQIGAAWRLANALSHSRGPTAHPSF